MGGIQTTGIGDERSSPQIKDRLYQKDFAMHSPEVVGAPPEVIQAVIMVGAQGI